MGLGACALVVAAAPGRGLFDSSDVERVAHRRDILRRVLDHPVVGCVDGEAILNDAEIRARELDVVNLRG